MTPQLITFADPYGEHTLNEADSVMLQAMAQGPQRYTMTFSGDGTHGMLFHYALGKCVVERDGKDFVQVWTITGKGKRVLRHATRAAA